MKFLVFKLISREYLSYCVSRKLTSIFQAAWGGGLLLSKKYRHPRLTGIERADSVTWNPHKLMGTLLQCSTIHFKQDVSYKARAYVQVREISTPQKHAPLNYWEELTIRHSASSTACLYWEWSCASWVQISGLVPISYTYFILSFHVVFVRPLIL